MNADALIKIKPIAMLFFFLAGILASSGGIYAPAWCGHSGNLLASHFINDDFFLNIAHDFSDHSGLSAPGVQQTWSGPLHAGVHIPFGFPALASSGKQPIPAADFSQPQLCEDSISPRSFASVSLSSRRFTEGASLPDMSLVSLRSVVLLN